MAKARDVEAAQVQGEEKRKTLQREAELQQAVSKIPSFLQFDDDDFDHTECTIPRSAVPSAI